MSTKRKVPFQVFHDGLTYETVWDVFRSGNLYAIHCSNIKCGEYRWVAENRIYGLLFCSIKCKEEEG